MNPDIQQEINFEVAISILNDLIGRTSLDKLAEQKEAHPDQSTIARLEAKMNQFWDERAALRPDDRAEIERVLNEYGAILKNGLSVLDA